MYVMPEQYPLLLESVLPLILPELIVPKLIQCFMPVLIVFEVHIQLCEVALHLFTQIRVIYDLWDFLVKQDIKDGGIVVFEFA